MSDNNALKITKIMGGKGPLFCRREWMKHPNRPETETAMSDNKHSNALEITKIMGKKAHCFIEESG